MATMFSVQDILEQPLFELLGVDGIPDEKKEALTQQMAETIEVRTLERLMVELPETDQQRLEELAQANNQEDLNHFLGQHKEIIERISLEEIARYRVELAAILGLTTTVSDTASPVNQLN